MTSFAIIIISVNFHLELISAKFLPFTISYSCSSIPVNLIWLTKGSTLANKNSNTSYFQPYLRAINIDTIPAVSMKRVDVINKRRKYIYLKACQRAEWLLPAGSSLGLSTSRVAVTCRLQLRPVNEPSGCYLQAPA